MSAGGARPFAGEGSRVLLAYTLRREQSDDVIECQLGEVDSRRYGSTGYFERRIVPWSDQ